MTTTVSVTIDDKIFRYAKSQEDIKDKSASEWVTDFLNEWYEEKLRNLHRQYLTGDLTLRGMARRLGLDYRELYELMETKGLTV